MTKLARIFARRVDVCRINAWFFGITLGGPKNDLMLEIFLGKRHLAIDLSLPINRVWVDKYKETDEYLTEEFINETKVSNKNSDKV